jgi:hypothetical protein
MNFIRIVLDLIGWLQIVIGSTIIGVLVGGVFYYFLPDWIGIIIFISLISLAFVAGVVLATRIWIRKRTIEWLSKIKRIS